MTCVVIDPHLNDLCSHPVFPPSLCDLYFNRVFLLLLLLFLYRAIKNGKGLHSKKEVPIHRVADISGVSCVPELCGAEAPGAWPLICQSTLAYVFSVACLFLSTECEFFQDCCLYIYRDSVLYSGKAELKLELKTFSPVT